MEKKYLASCLQEGMSQRAIAADAGTSQTNIRYWLKRHGLASPRPRRRATETPAAVAHHPGFELPPPPSVDLNSAGLPKNDTNLAGVITGARVLAALTRAGYPCYVPFGVGKADLIMETSVGLRSVQAKTGTFRQDGRAMMFRTHTVGRDGHRTNYRGVVDFFGVACPGVPGVYLIPVEDVGTTQAHLRLAAPMNNQQRRMRDASVYLVPGSDVA